MKAKSPNITCISCHRGAWEDERGNIICANCGIEEHICECKPTNQGLGQHFRYDYCDNTNCPSSDRKVRLYPVEMREEFDSEGSTFWWCKECIKRDQDMLNFNPLK